MSLRSLLFVPGDSERKYGKAVSTAADALILDLEDSVSASRKGHARRFVSESLAERPDGFDGEIWVRINPINAEDGLRDLAAVVPARPDGIMLPKCEGTATLQKLGHFLDILEVDADVCPGSTKILPIVTETLKAPFVLHEFAEVRVPRLHGMTWGAEDLSSAIGASTNKDSHGGWLPTYSMLRSMMLLAAKAAGVAAVDTLYTDFRDGKGLRRNCEEASAEGFTGKIAIHPDQVDIINSCFVPSPEEVEMAERIIAAFEAHPDTGTVSLDGRMLDLPHLTQARSVLARSRGN